MSQGEVYDILTFSILSIRQAAGTFVAISLAISEYLSCRFGKLKVEFRFAGQGRQNQRLSQGQVYSGWFGKPIHFVHLNLDVQASQSTIRKNEPRPPAHHNNENN